MCPMCSGSGRHKKARFSMSVSERDGKLLFYCHRCKADGATIIKRLVALGILPDLVRAASATMTIVTKVRTAMRSRSWIRSSDITDLQGLQALLEIAARSCKEIFGAAVREIAEIARISESAAWQSLQRLSRDGWIQKVTRGDAHHPDTWRLLIPAGYSVGQDATAARKEGHGSSIGAFARGGRTPVPSFEHDLFRRGKGLGFSKGRLYVVLKTPMRAEEIAQVLGYEDARNVRLHLSKMLKLGLVHRRDDGRYERGDADLDVLATRLGVAEASDKDRTRHLRERQAWRKRIAAFEHWTQTGTVVDPETGEFLGQTDIPHRGVKRRSFNAVLAIERARR